ncbi:MAG: hypothetical protein ACYC42_09225 [Lysobacter sp.]
MTTSIRDTRAYPTTLPLRHLDVGLSAVCGDRTVDPRRVCVRR